MKKHLTILLTILFFQSQAFCQLGFVSCIFSSFTMDAEFTASISESINIQANANVQESYERYYDPQGKLGNMILSTDLIESGYRDIDNGEILRGNAKLGLAGLQTIGMFTGAGEAVVGMKGAATVALAERPSIKSLLQKANENIGLTESLYLTTPAGDSVVVNRWVYDTTKMFQNAGYEVHIIGPYRNINIPKVYKYTSTADITDAIKFQLPTEVYNSMTVEQVTLANKLAIQKSISKGRIFINSDVVNIKYTDYGVGLKNEYRWLMEGGYDEVGGIFYPMERK